MVSTNRRYLDKIIEDDETCRPIIFFYLTEVIIEYFMDDIIHTIDQLFN